MADPSADDESGQAEQPAAPAARLSSDNVMARLSGRTTFLTLQLGINLCAAMIGLGLYLLLVNAWHIIPLIAAVFGLGCALLTRKALATGLVTLLLLRVRQRAREQGDLPSQ